MAGHKLRIAVIGAGALGSAVLNVLHSRHYASVLLIDPDRVEGQNLALSPLLSRAMDRRSASPLASSEPPNKAQLLAWEAETFDALPWRSLPVAIADVGWGVLKDIDVLCCCTDSALSRVETAYIARMLGRPMIDGAVYGDGIPGGRVSYFSPAPGAACYLCGMSEDSRAAILGYAASASMGCRALEDSPAMTGTREALQRVGEAVACALMEPPAEPTQSTAVRLQRLNGAHPRWDAVRLMLPRSATCPWHEETQNGLTSIPWEEALRDALQSDGTQPARDLQLAWPVCTEAICNACGSHSHPFQRVGRVRSGLPCPGCGQVELQSVRAVHRIRAEDDLSRRSPRQLGQPEHHLYWLRDTVARSASAHEDTLQ